jgi:hypothetical protein
MRTEVKGLTTSYPTFGHFLPIEGRKKASDAVPKPFNIPANRLNRIHDFVPLLPRFYRYLSLLLRSCLRTFCAKAGNFAFPRADSAFGYGYLALKKPNHRQAALGCGLHRR